MARRGHLRASDLDREGVAERLRHAATEGRLSTDELEQRLMAALSARTYAELDALTADLPGKGLTRVQRRNSELAAVLRPALVLAIAVPLTMVVLAAIFFLVTGVFAFWVVWLPLAWCFLGRHRHYRARAYRSPHRRHHVAHRYGPAPQRPRGFWL